jgi:hypothetical protein
LGEKVGRRSNGEGSIARRKDGRWQAAFTFKGKRHYMYGKTRKEVAGKLRETLAGSDGTYYPDIQVEDYLNRWLEDSVKGSVRASTHERYESVCRVHIIPQVGDKRLADLTEMLVQSLYRERLGSGCSARTVRYVHVTLHKALKQAVKWRLVPRNVAEAAVPPRVQKKEIVVLSPAQVKVFLRSVDGHRLEAMFALPVTTGMRQGELTGLRWEDVDVGDGECEAPCCGRSYPLPHSPRRYRPQDYRLRDTEGRNTHILGRHSVACYMTYSMHQCAQAARLVSGMHWLFVGPDGGTRGEGNGRRDDRGQGEDRALDRVAVGGHEHHRKGRGAEGTGTCIVPRPGEAVQERGGGPRVRALATALVAAGLR